NRPLLARVFSVHPEGATRLEPALRPVRGEPWCLRRNYGGRSRMSPRVLVGRESGYIFRAESGDAFCFVPDHCVLISPAGGVSIDYLAYIASGWGARNLHLADADVPGSYLFPATAGLVEDLAAPAVREFVARLGSFGAGGGARANRP